jgi:2',3'-cyclic-nucleotide 2'-phosphodiesterase
MRLLYVGDIMGETGVEVVEQMLPDLRKDKRVDVVIAQAENVSEGRGITAADYRRLQAAGVDCFTGGNWTLHREEIYAYLQDAQEPILRPANYPAGTTGLPYKILTLQGKRCLIVSLMGHIVGKDADKPFDNPLQAVDAIIEHEKSNYDMLVVNLHGDYSSEKVIIGHYLDGRASLVVGDHWHVPTADARVLPKGTAHITDVGMCGILNASLGVSFTSVVPRWRDNQQTRNVLETKGPRQFNGLLVDVGDDGLAQSVELIQKIM